MTRYDICIYVNLIKIQILHTCSIIISAFKYYISRFIKFQKTKLWPSSLYFEKILGQKSAFHICFVPNIQYLLDYLTVRYTGCLKKKWDLFYDLYLQQIKQKYAEYTFHLNGGIHSSIRNMK